MSRTYQFDDNFSHKTIISLGLFLIFSVFKNIVNFTKWLHTKLFKKNKRNLIFNFELIIKYFLELILLTLMMNF